MPREPIPIACSLPLPDGARQALEWQELRRQALSVSPTTGGVVVEYPLELRSDVRDLVQRESSCCAFLDFDLTEHSERLRLQITSTDPDAAPVIELLAGLRP